MEQTQNTFTSGLLMDTHPMLQGLDSLTDALNATFVTMNGNEIVLQNDMGNASVQHAYLPHGYVPVGMKEYGGVIYVASYNPLTDRGQIGSFPSPQRRHFEHEQGVGNFNPEDFLEDERLKLRTMLIPINNGSDTILRAGDKFVLYSDNLHDFKDYISNWENVEDAKIKSPKNNYFTLSAGILNSKNEFVDITKTLHRFDDYGEIITEFENESELYKFNKGYFINNLFEESDYNYISSGADSAIKEARELDKLKLNTYAYKLVGPLYIKAELNAPTDFDFSVSGTNHDGEIELNINYVLTYNCPDGIYNLSRESNDIYYDYYDNKITTFGLKLKTYGDIFDNLNISDIPGITKYDSITNTYKVINNKTINFNIESVFESRTLDIGGFPLNGVYYTQEPIIFKKDLIYKIEVTSDINNLDLYVKSSDDVYYKTTNKSIIIQRFEDYILVENLYGVPIPLYIGSNMISSATVSANTLIFTDSLIPTFKKWGNEDIDIEISDLAREFSIDLSKLGSGEMELKSWRFYNDVANKTTSITYGFDAYPREGHEFKGLSFNFYKLTGNEIVTDEESEGYPIIKSGAEYVGSYSIGDEIGYNGVRDDVISWGDLENFSNRDDVRIGLEERLLYQVIIRWYDYDGQDYVPNYEYRWLLTTPLFNNSYFLTKNEFIGDFCNPSGEKEEEIYNNLITISPQLLFDLKTDKGSGFISKNEIGLKLYDESDEDEHDFGYQNNFGLVLNSDVSVFWNENNYPEFILEISPAVIDIKLNKNDVKSSLKIPTIVGDKDKLQVNKWIGISDEESEGFLFDKEYEGSNQHLTYISNVYTIDKLVGTLSKVLINNGVIFKPLEYILLQEEYEKSNGYISQGAISIITSDSKNNDTRHLLFFSKSADEESDSSLLWRGGLDFIEGIDFSRYSKHDERTGASYPLITEVDTKFGDGTKGDYDYTFNYDDIKDDLNYAINNSVLSSKFMVLGISVFKTPDEGTYYPYLVSWIRTGDDTWGLLGIKKYNDIEYKFWNKSGNLYTKSKLCFDTGNDYFSNYMYEYNDSGHTKTVENKAPYVRFKTTTGNNYPIPHYYDWFNQPDKFIMAYEDGEDNSQSNKYAISSLNIIAYNEYYESNIIYNFNVKYY